jgi:hypothetical protein
LVQAFQKPELSRAFGARLDAEFRDHPQIGSDNTKHLALVETILKYRDQFPPEGFSIRTDLGDGASIDTVIPSLADSRK